MSDDLDVLQEKAAEVEAVLKTVPGAADETQAPRIRRIPWRDQTFSSARP